jgi:nucleoid-associated protein YgaU
MKYRIRKGDTLEGIAKATLGDGTRWKDIVAVNPGLDPRRLKIDQEITIPDGASVSVARAPAPAPAPKAPPVRSLVNPEDGATGPERASFREVEVRSGDTLYTIARRELGNGDLHYKIQKANPGLDPKRLRVGQKVRVPVDG